MLANGGVDANGGYKVNGTRGYIYVPLNGRVVVWNAVVKGSGTNTLVQITGNYGVPTNAKVIKALISCKSTNGGLGSDGNTWVSLNNTSFTVGDKYELYARQTANNVLGDEFGDCTLNANGKVQVYVSGSSGASVYVWIYVLGYYV